MTDGEDLRPGGDGSVAAGPPAEDADGPQPEGAPSGSPAPGTRRRGRPPARGRGRGHPDAAGDAAARHASAPEPGPRAPGTLLRLIGIAMPRAGHQVAGMVLGRLLGERFAHCAFYDTPGCCRRIPCARAARWAQNGAVAFLQKTHDHALKDPLDPAADGLLIQVREPVARALSKYELDLATTGVPHSPSYLRYAMGLEAAYTVGFIRKWCLAPPAQAHLLRYEALVEDPVAAFRGVFDRFGLPASMFDEATVRRAQALRSGDQDQPFRPRAIRQSPHYDPAILGEFQAIVAADAAAIGYRPDPGLARRKGRGDAAPGALTLAFTARAAMLGDDRSGALEAFDRYLALPDAHVLARRHRARLLRQQGDVEAAEAELRIVTEAMPRHAPAWIDLARSQRQRGATTEAVGTLEDCLAASANPVHAAQAILRAFDHPALVAGAQALRPSFPPTREDVVHAFRFILGREPESEAVIEAHRNIPTMAALRETLLRSLEFGQKFSKLLLGDVPAEEAVGELGAEHRAI